MRSCVQRSLVASRCCISFRRSRPLTALRWTESGWSLARRRQSTGKLAPSGVRHRRDWAGSPSMSIRTCAADCSIWLPAPARRSSRCSKSWSRGPDRGRDRPARRVAICTPLGAGHSVHHSGDGPDGWGVSQQFRIERPGIRLGGARLHRATGSWNSTRSRSRSPPASTSWI